MNKDRKRLYDVEAGKAWGWWKSLQPDDANGHRGDRATLARLKRASSILEAMSEPAVAELYRRLGFKHTKHDAERDGPRAALIAAVLAHVRKDDEKLTPLARAIGAPRGGDDSQQLVTPLRFKRIVAAREPDELLVAFRRAVAILGDTANVSDLARTLLAFTDPVDNRADIARTQFAFAYHGAARFAPETNASPDTTIATEA
ncbi:MAG: type I-E CRISPR-associated protein Cse2/CasB [Hyphomicrobiaceae bacterium]